MTDGHDVASAAVSDSVVFCLTDATAAGLDLVCGVTARLRVIRPIAYAGSCNVGQ